LNNHWGEKHPNDKVQQSRNDELFLIALPKTLALAFM
jgi:hypothetical protein